MKKKIKSVALKRGQLAAWKILRWQHGICVLLLFAQLGSTMFSSIRSRSFQSYSFLLHTSHLFNKKHFSKKSLLRTVTLLPKPYRKSVKLDKSHHRLIYSFPYIPFIAGFLKSKKSVPIVSFSLLPVLYYLDETHTSPVVTALSASTYFAMGSVISKFAVNVVGKMYVNKENEITEVIMSSVDEFGRRIDRIHKIEDLINIDSPTKFSRSMGFIAIGVENSGIYYKVNTRYCKFVDQSACDWVFGFAGNETSASESKETQEAEDITKKLSEK